MTQISSPIQVTPQDVFTSDSTQQADLGQMAITTDGRKFRYAKAGLTALVAGTLQQSPAEVANHTNATVQAAAAAGDLTISITLGATAATANQYAGGYIAINDVAGQGYTYRIKSHPAADSAATLTVTLDAEDAVQEALTTSSQATLVSNPYNAVIIHPTASTGIPVGVPLIDTPISEFCWLQTSGPVAVLNDLGTAIGLGVAPSTNVAGAVMTVAATTNQVGSAAVAGISTEYNPVELRID